LLTFNVVIIFIIFIPGDECFLELVKATINNCPKAEDEALNLCQSYNQHDLALQIVNMCDIDYSRLPFYLRNLLKSNGEWDPLSDSPPIFVKKGVTSKAIEEESWEIECLPSETVETTFKFEEDWETPEFHSTGKSKIPKAIDEDDWGMEIDQVEDLDDIEILDVKLGNSSELKGTLLLQQKMYNQLFIT